MTRSRKVLKSTEDVIAAYGGPAKCGRRWDCTTAAVSQWRAGGIPTGYHYRMATELEAQGYIVDGHALGWL